LVYLLKKPVFEENAKITVLEKLYPEFLYAIMQGTGNAGTNSKVYFSQFSLLFSFKQLQSLG